MDNNILRLAALQEHGELPPAAEEALALEFVARHESDMRFVAKWGRWLGFDGVRWHFDDTLHAFDRARDICREAARDCEKAGTASTVASAKTVAAVERLAKADRRLAAAVEQWDAAPWLLTDTQATYDLRTGVGREPDRRDYLTKRAASSSGSSRSTTWSRRRCPRPLSYWPGSTRSWPSWPSCGPRLRRPWRRSSACSRPATAATNGGASTLCCTRSCVPSPGNIRSSQARTSAIRIRRAVTPQSSGTEAYG
jgi:hypothetical protein